MNEFLAALILAIVQGITEWLPISSSGHLLIFHLILGYEPSLVFDVALHFGTLMAVFVYFGKDIVNIVKEVCSFRFRTENGRLGLLIMLATMPAAFIGYFFLDFFKNIFDNLTIVAFGFAITGVFLFIAGIGMPPLNKKFGWKEALVVGISQVFSILPGISRSGSTIASGMLLGLSTKQAAKFSFLMAIPIIFGANIGIIGNNYLPPELIWATIVSFIVGLATMHFLFRFVLTSRRNLRWFGIYALLLAVGIWVYLIL